MLGKKGFTLTELLIAATIASIMLAVAMVEYRKSAAETRWAQAKAFTEQIGNGVQRAELDYEQISFECNQPMANTVEGCTFSRAGGGRWNPSGLIPCGYVDKGIWKDSYFLYYVCKNSGSDSCPACTGSAAGALACAVANCDSKVPSEYKSHRYCVFKDRAPIEEKSFNACGSGEED